MSVIAALLLAGCVTTPTTTGGTTASGSPQMAATTTAADSVSANVGRVLNGERTSRGLNALTFSPQLASAARRHVNDMASRGFFSHTGSNGSSIGQRIAASGFRSCLSAENIARGQSNAESTMAGWMASSGHRANNLRNGVTHYGAAYNSNGGLWVLVFGKAC